MTWWQKLHFSDLIEYDVINMWPEWFQVSCSRFTMTMRDIQTKMPLGLDLFALYLQTYSIIPSTIVEPFGILYKAL